MTTPVETNDHSNEVSDNYSKIDGMLKDIDNSTDSKESRDELNQLLTQEFLDSFVNSLTEDQKINLTNNVKNIYEKFKDGANFNEDYSGLLTLAKSLNINLEGDGALDGDDVSNEKEDAQMSLGLVGEFGDASKEKGEPSLGKGVCRDESENDGSIDEYGKLYEVLGDVNNQKDQIDELLKNEKLKENKDLTYLQALMENISVVLDNPTEDNVRKLQSYIYSNMDGKFKQEDIDEFKTKNFDKSKNQFDGKLGKNTIKWLKEGLKKTQNYINDLNEYIKQDNSETTNGEGGDGNKDKEENGGSIDTTPMEIGEDKYLVAENSEAISRECHISNAIFYSVVSSTTTIEQLSDGTYPRASSEVSDGGKREYYVQLTNNPDVYYKVELDASGNLCPIATEYNRQLKDENGKPVESKILISNNDSCKKYLYNKLPDAIRNSGISIGWDNVGKDYTLSSHLGILTIEPLSIAGDWISNDKSIPIDQRISRNLAFLNLTNYIRYLGKKFKKKDPDINSDLELKGIKIDKQKVRIDKGDFGLKDATSDELSRFKKYNNGEHWRDNWDNKGKNKYYRKIYFK